MAVVLKSPRLLLRDFYVEDWQDIHAYASRPDVCRFQVWGPNTPEESRAHVAEVMASAQANPRRAFHLAVVLPSTGRVIGEGGIDIRSQRFRQGEISYVLHPTYWGHGLATEMASPLLSFGFTTLHLHRIFATCDPRNLASERVLQKVGMHCEGCMHETLLLRDGWRDSALYSVLQQDWQ